MSGGFHMHTIVLIAMILLIAAVSLALYVFFSRRVDRAAFRFAPGPEAFPFRRPGNGRHALSGSEEDTLLAIADISGYTNFMTLSRFSLGHAQYIVSELLDAVINGMAPQLRPAKIEGDAVLGSTAGGGRVPSADHAGGAVLRMAANFYGRREALRRANLCTCEACSEIGSLELKIIVHRGPVLLYSLREFHELSGVPVIEVHRLLKNQIAAPRYILVTRSAARALALPKTFRGAGYRHVDADVGEIPGVVYAYDPGDLPTETVPPEGGAERTHWKDLMRKLGRNVRMIGHSLRPSRMSRMQRGRAAGFD